MNGRAAAGLSGGSIHNELLFDLFEDQVNLVKLQTGGPPRSMLFVPGTPPKKIP